MQVKEAFCHFLGILNQAQKINIIHFIMSQVVYTQKSNHPNEADKRVQTTNQRHTASTWIKNKPQQFELVRPKHITEYQNRKIRKTSKPKFLPRFWLTTFANKLTPTFTHYPIPNPK